MTYIFLSRAFRVGCGLAAVSLVAVECVPAPGDAPPDVSLCVHAFVGCVEQQLLVVHSGPHLPPFLRLLGWYL